MGQNLTMQTADTADQYAVGPPRILFKTLLVSSSVRVAIMKIFPVCKCDRHAYKRISTPSSLSKTVSLCIACKQLGFRVAGLLLQAFSSGNIFQMHIYHYKNILYIYCGTDIATYSGKGLYLCARR